MILISERNINLYLKKHNIQTRPNASHGLWLMFLLPAALIASATSHPVISTTTYKLSSLFSVGLILSSLIFLYETSKNIRLRILNIWLLMACAILATLFGTCFSKGLVFSTWSAMVATVIYTKFYIFILQKLPNCFTLGEAAICSQAYVLLLHFTTLNIFNNLAKSSDMQKSTLTIQIGLLGLSTIIFLSYKFNIKDPKKVYILIGTVFLGVVIPLQQLMKMNPLLWIVHLFWNDLQRNKVILYWMVFSIVAVVFVNRRIKTAKRASTSVRKVFHFLITAVFIPGLLYNCSLLYLASGVVLGIFFMLEILRVLNVPPLAEGLQNGIVIFGDEKDTGIIAFTPMYLLAGCSLPLWIHPSPCDVTNSAFFSLLPLLSGILTIGVGDTAASIVGSKLGRHYWKGSKKTIEGTFGCICSQLLFVFTFVYLDFVKFSSVVEVARTIVAVVIAAVIEAKTDQVDNLVLPFIMYIILIL